MTNQERLNRICAGIRDVCTVMDVFLLGGGLSTSLEGKVPAVVVAVIGLLITDNPLTKPFKNPGDKIILIGKSDDDGNDTAFRAKIDKEMKPAKPLFIEERVSMRAALAAAKTGFVHSFSDLGAAGIGAAVCEGAKVGGLGADIELSNVLSCNNKKLSLIQLILYETQARYLLTVSPQSLEAVWNTIKRARGIATVIGEVNENKETIFRYNGEKVASIPNQPSEKILNLLSRM